MKYSLHSARILTAALVLVLPAVQGTAGYPPHRPARTTPAAPEGNYTIHPDQPKQIIQGIGFEIQSDSIASGNKGLTEDFTGVPHDLTPEERTRFYNEMLKGFRYVRLAAGLYWRGLTPDQKNFQGRWPEQLPELKEMIQQAGLDGVELEYWSPAPYWKANGKLDGTHTKYYENTLKCFVKEFANDPDYHGDKDKFLADFAQACVQDVKTLNDAGLPVKLWGLQNEPFASTPYSSCTYSGPAYQKTFMAVAPALKKYDPNLKILADTGPSWKFPWIGPIVRQPETSHLVDYLVRHACGADSKSDIAPPGDYPKPMFENEYEYLDGPATADRCINTVQDAMNWFQLNGAPIWYWIHALKPVGNSEGSGYSLGFWRPQNADPTLGGDKFKDLQPGHWTYNNYNWFAVGSLVKNIPWNSQVVAVDEAVRDNDLRILAFKRPDGKLTVMLSNRSGAPHTFHIDTGLTDATFKGVRYSPTDAGTNCLGVPIADSLAGGTISPQLQDRTWEFWTQQ